MELLEGAPVGIANAANILNLMPQDILAETCQNVLQYLQQKKGNVDNSSLRSSCAATGCDLKVEEVESATNGLLFIFRSAIRNKASPDDIKRQLVSSSTWSQKVMDIICQTWQQQSPRLVNTSSPEQLLGVGRLIDLQWKLGMATSSNLCRNLSLLFVTMVIKVADPSGNVTSKSFEMTIPEFQNFSQQFSSISLDAV